MRPLSLVGVGVLSLSTALAAVAGCGADDSGAGSSLSASVDSGSEVTLFGLSVTVVGLQGSGLVLQEKGGAELAVAGRAGGGTRTVSLTTAIPAGAEYEVTVKVQPTSPMQHCGVTGGAGRVVAGVVPNITVNCTMEYTVGGAVTGLAGTNLILQNNGAADAVVVNANGGFAFTKGIGTGGAYTVTVKQNPTNKWQTCTVLAGGGAPASGVIAGASVTNVAVACTTNKYALSVNVIGLAGSGLVFQNGLGNDLGAAADGKRTFATAVESGADYNVTVLSQPTAPWQTCTVSNGHAQMMGADLTLNVACVANKHIIGGTLLGLQGNGLVLQNNLGDDLTLNAPANGAFSFATKIASGQAYNVTVKTQPSGVDGELCSARARTGVVAGVDVATVSVACTNGKKVFVSSAHYTGNVGGLSGADAICQGLANAAALAGTYKAWLSDSTGSPATRFTRSAFPYVLVDNTVVANDWAGLVSGTLLHAIDKTETGGVPTQGDPTCTGRPFSVWSNTRADGTQYDANSSCSDWTRTPGNGHFGQYTSTTLLWSSSCESICSRSEPIYCVQQ